MMRKKQNRIRQFSKWIGIAASVATVLTFLLSLADLFTGGKVIGWNHEIVSLSADQTFSVTAISDRFGRTLGTGDEFSYLYGTPISIRGVTQFIDTDKIWVVLRDRYGSLYLQNPPVTILRNQWKVTNIQPLNGITDILFIKVDSSGNSIFVQHVEANNFSLSSLPTTSTTVGFIELR